MLFYLQTACVAITMIHMWILPYQNEFLNAFDGVILLCIVLEVNINLSLFEKFYNRFTEVFIVIVLFSLSLLSIIAIKKVIHFCIMKWYHRHYDPINGFVDDKRDSDMVIRFVCGLVNVLSFHGIIGKHTSSMNWLILPAHNQSWR